MKLSEKALAIAAATLLACVNLNAETLFNASSTPVNERYTASGPYTIGNSFTVNAANLQITALGIMDVQGDGGTPPSTGTYVNDGFINGPLSVGLWNASGSQLLASATVTSTDTYIAGYHYVTLATPFVLTQGATYLIGATVGFGLEPFLDSTGVISTGSADFTLTASSYANGATLQAPTGGSAGSADRWGAANAIVTAVPEPATYGLIGSGTLAGIALVRRRRRIRIA